MISAEVKQLETGRVKRLVVILYHVRSTTGSNCDYDQLTPTSCHKDFHPCESNLISDIIPTRFFLINSSWQQRCSMEMCQFNIHSAKTEQDSSTGHCLLFFLSFSIPQSKKIHSLTSIKAEVILFYQLVAYIFLKFNIKNEYFVLTS